MAKALIDRWTDTTTFRLLLFFSAWLVFPVLAAGILTTVIGGAGMFVAQSDIGLEEAVFACLSIGGALGFAGYLRAHRGIKDPRHNVTATLLCLAAGIAAALVVAAFVVVTAVASWLTPWGSGVWLWIAAAFVAANLVWATAGVAWMRRITRSLAERTGLAFDALPIVLLLVATTLATAAALVATTL